MWSYNKNSRNQLYYWCNWLLHITICALPTKREAIAWTIEPDAWWELSLWEELFRSHKKLKRCGGFFFDVFGVVMTVYMNWKNTLALMLQKKDKEKNQTNEQTTTTTKRFPMFQWVQCPVSILSRSSNLWEKKIWKK